MIDNHRDVMNVYILIIGAISYCVVGKKSENKKLILFYLTICFSLFALTTIWHDDFSQYLMVG